MCGIAGIVGLNPSVTVPRVREALKRLEHRGPDGEGLHVGDQAVLGMRRLAIIDVAHGDQPIYNETRDIAVVCNGELYNYKEVLPALVQRGHTLQSGSDINMLPHLYEEVKLGAFDECRGMFAAALWDDKEKRLVLARDRVGKKPLFWSRVGEGIAFASELPALLALLDRTPSHSAPAIASYLQLGYIPHPDTIYEGVHALAPGTTLSFSNGEVAISEYWRPTQPETFRGSREDALGEIDSRLREAVKLRLRSDVPMGLFLSGGIDSGLVASYAAECGASDLMCFVVEVPDGSLNEAPAARAVAKSLGLPVETISVDMDVPSVVSKLPSLYGQPFADSSAIPSYLVARAARASRKCVLNGDGGDEIFGGYRRYWLARAAKYLAPVAAPVRPLLNAVGERMATTAHRRSSVGFASRALRGLGAPNHTRYVRWTTDLLDDSSLNRVFPELSGGELPLPRLRSLRGYGVETRGLREFQQSDYRLNLADDLLSKMDIATMANSVEARSPFLDVPLAEFAWSLPEHWLISYTETKPLLRTIARKRLPESVASAPKRGFEAPVARWLSADLAQTVKDTLLASDSRVSRIGDARAVQDLVAGRDDFAGNRAQAVWALLVLELFLREPAPSPAAP